MGAYRFGAKLVLLRPVYRGRRKAPEFLGVNTFPNSLVFPLSVVMCIVGHSSGSGMSRLELW